MKNISYYYVQKESTHQCAYTLLINEQFCPKCGKSREAINKEYKEHFPDIKQTTKDAPKCPSCQKFRKIGEEFLFCPYCGKKY